MKVALYTYVTSVAFQLLKGNIVQKFFKGSLFAGQPNDIIQACPVSKIINLAVTYPARQGIGAK